MVFKLLLAAWNSHSCRIKTEEIAYFIKKHRIDIFFISETKLIKTDKFEIKGFQAARRDRSNNTRHGGVLILVKIGIPFKILPETNCSIENIGIELSNGLKIISIYNRASNNFQNTCLQKLLSANRTILVGDFNARHNLWNCLSDNVNGRTLHRFLGNNFDCKIYHSPGPTHFPYNNNTPSTLDFIIAKGISSIKEPESLPELPSDHNVIKFTLTDNQRVNNSKKIYDYSSTNWKEFRKIINNKILINNNISSIECLENELSKFSEAIISARNITSKIKVIRPFTDQLPDEIINLIKYRNRLRKSWQTHRDLYDKELANTLTQQIKIKIENHRNEEWENKLAKLTPSNGSLWKMTKFLKKEPRIIPTLTVNSIDHNTDERKAEILANTFKETHNIGSTNSDEDQNIINSVSAFLLKHKNIHSDNTKHYLTNPSELKNIIKDLLNNKAPGLDGIDNKLIKNLPKKAIVQFNYIINAIINLQHWPSNWKTSLVIPIPKTGKNTKSPENYRPISLLSTLSKIAEKIVSKIISKTMKKTNMRDPCQFGFKEKHNSTHQLCRIIVDVINKFNKKQNTAMVLLDIEKAFDRIWIQGLIYKMIKLVFPPFIIKLVHSYLSNRNFKVKVNEHISDLKSIQAGVPQGSILGPKLFNLYIHDLPGFPNTKTALFADDTAIYAHSFSSVVANRLLQYNIYNLMNYYETWKIKVNEKKTEQLVFSRKTKNSNIIVPLKIHNHPIIPKTSVKYLGMVLDKRLNLHKHVENTLRKAQGAIKVLFPLMSRKGKLSEKNKKLIYTTLIRPIITYAAPAYCHLKSKPLKPLQIFQNKILRLITNSDRFTKITELHDRTGIETIRDHINRISSKFYDNTKYVSDLVNEITITRQNSRNENGRHVLPYEHLPIYGKVFRTYRARP